VSIAPAHNKCRTECIILIVKCIIYVFLSEKITAGTKIKKSRANPTKDWEVICGMLGNQSFQH
jgi:hypothetical protein